MRTNFQIGKSS